MPTEKQIANLIPFKKGEVKNPNGRGKGTENWATLFKRLAKIVPKLDKDTSKFFGLDSLPSELKKDARTLKHILALKVFEKASSGDLTALKMIMERMDGLPLATVAQIDLSPKPLFDEEDPNSPFGFQPIQLPDAVAEPIDPPAPEPIEAPPVPPQCLPPASPESPAAKSPEPSRRELRRLKRLNGRNG